MIRQAVVQRHLLSKQREASKVVARGKLYLIFSRQHLKSLLPLHIRELIYFVGNMEIQIIILQQSCVFHMCLKRRQVGSSSGYLMLFNAWCQNLIKDGNEVERKLKMNVHIKRHCPTVCYIIHETNFTAQQWIGLLSIGRERLWAIVLSNGFRSY